MATILTQTPRGRNHEDPTLEDPTLEDPTPDPTPDPTGDVPVPEAPLVERRPARTARPNGRISEQVSVALGILWVVGYLAVGALEPATPHELPTIAIALTVGFHVALLATAAGLIARRRWGIGASIGASGIFLAATVACPVTGHHTFGLWWGGQMVVSLALVAASVAALALSDRPRLQASPQSR